MDRTNYEDIEPYRRERIEEATARLVAREVLIGGFA